jgi:hypothetical protein
MSERRSPVPANAAREKSHGAQPRPGAFEGGRAAAVIALGAAVVASFSLEQPFGGVLLALVLAVSAVVAALAILAALNKQGRRRRSQRNGAASASSAGRAAMFGAWDYGVEHDAPARIPARERVDAPAPRSAHGSHAGL